MRLIAYLCLLLVVLVNLSSVKAQAPHPVDRQAMLNLLSSSFNWPSRFSIADIDNMCNWIEPIERREVVACNSEGRIIEFRYNPSNLAGRPFLNGTIPSDFWALPALEVVELPRSTRLHGTVPAAFFQLPNIREIQIWNSAQTVIFPQTISTSIKIFRVGGVQLVGKLWDTWNTANFTAIEIEDLPLQCPLPAWFVNGVLNKQFVDTCQLTQSGLYIENDAICGQIPANKTACWMLPTASARSSLQRNRPGHRLGNEFVEVQLNGTTMYIYGVKQTGRQRYVYYDEWVGMEFQGWQLRGIDGAAAAVAAVRWGDTLTELVPGTNYSIPLHLSDGTIMTVLLYLRHPFAPEGIKFAFRMNKPSSFNYSDPANDAYTKMSIAMNPVIRQHLFSRQPMSCTTGNLLAANCSSDISWVALNPALLDGCTGISGSMRGPRLAIEMNFQGCYSIDGTPNIIEELDMSPFIPGIGSLRSFTRLYQINSSIPVPIVAPEDQIVVLPFSSAFKRFNSITWDPDVRITLLFNPPTPPDEPPATTEAVNGAVVGGTIGGVLGAILILGIVFGTDLKYKWLPFRRRAEEDAKLPKPDIELDDEAEADFAPPGESSQPKNQRWSQGSRSRASITNVV